MLIVVFMPTHAISMARVVLPDLMEYVSKYAGEHLYRKKLSTRNAFFATAFIHPTNATSAAFSAQVVISPSALRR
jgi:hypothetical protein